MNDSSRLSRGTLNPQSYYAGAAGKRLSDSDAKKERAQRLYAIGELKAAAQLLCELAAGRHPHQAEDLGEAVHG
ncbi:MAG: hypothetical protein ABSE42_15910 [Bryobacteraceae bacterium]|jgi:hypothetical protein